MKKTILSMALCLILILSGCAQRGNESPESTPKTEAPSAQTSSSSQSSTSIAVKQADWSGIQGKITGIYPAGGSKVLVLADQMSLYDLASDKIVATAKTPKLSAICVQTLNSGYAIVGQSVTKSSSGGFAQDDSSPQFHAAIYDENLLLKSDVEISGLVADGEFLIDTEAIAVSSDGNRIAFATTQGITLYDCSNKKRSKLIDLTVENEKAHLGISGIEQIGFTNNEKSVAFKAQSLDVPAVFNKPSFDTIGTVNIDGKGLTNKKPDGYEPKMLTCYPSRLLVAEDFKTASGHMMVIDNKSGEQKIHTLSDKKEGENIYGSDTGSYFASSVPSETGWTVRVYDTNSGKLVKKVDISNNGQELYGINDPMLCVLDDRKTCTVLLGHKQKAVDTKIASFSF